MHKVSRASMISRGLRLGCINCGRQGLFRGWLKLRYRCPGCGMKLARSEGFFLGAMVWNYGLTVFGIIAPLALLGLLGVIPSRWVLVCCVISGLVMPIIFYRLSWCLWLSTYYCFLPHELPAHGNGESTVDEDE